MPDLLFLCLIMYGSKLYEGTRVHIDYTYLDYDRGKYCGSQSRYTGMQVSRNLERRRKAETPDVFPFCFHGRGAGNRSIYINSRKDKHTFTPS